MKINELLLFIVPCLTLLYTGLTKLIWPEQMVRRDLRRISEMGLRKHFLTSSWRAVITSICFFLAHEFIDLKGLWISMGVVILVAPIFFYLRGSVGEYGESMFNNMNDEKIGKVVHKKRKQGLVSLAVLLLWLYSWRNLLT
jgi:hypothetical protein